MKTEFRGWLLRSCLLASIVNLSPTLDAAAESLVVHPYDMTHNTPEFFLVTALFGGWGTYSVGSQTFVNYGSKGGENPLWVQWGYVMDTGYGYPAYLPVKVLEETHRTTMSSREYVRLQDRASGISICIAVYETGDIDVPVSYSLYAGHQLWWWFYYLYLGHPPAQWDLAASGNFRRASDGWD